MALTAVVVGPQALWLGVFMCMCTLAPRLIAYQAVPTRSRIYFHQYYFLVNFPSLVRNIHYFFCGQGQIGSAPKSSRRQKQKIILRAMHALYICVPLALSEKRTLVLVSPCFKSCFSQNVVATSNIGSFLCSLDNLLQKNVIVLLLEIKFQNGAHLKMGYFWPTFHIF